MLDDSSSRYGMVTRYLHWGVGLLILLQFLKLGDRIDEGEHWIGQTIVPWHISVGVLILLLAIVRLAWAARQHPRRPRPDAFVFLVRAGHFLLYACMFLMPVTGIMTMLGGGYGLTVFGIELAPSTGVETPWLIAAGSLHSPIAWAFVALVIGHVGAALYHHVVRRDQTLRRMLGR